MIDNLSPAQRKVLQIALIEGIITIGGVDETPDVHYRVIKNLHKKGYLDYKDPQTYCSVESHWTPTPKAILYSEEFLQTEDVIEKLRNNKKYQVKVPLKGYKLYEVSARTAQEAKKKADERSTDIETVDKYIYTSGKAVSAVIIK